MAKQLDKALVIDVESTCWEGYSPAGEISEIIEIGICEVDLSNLTRVSKRSILVQPMKSTISKFCTELTSITPEMVKGKPILEDACKILKNEYNSMKRLFASWGDYDRDQFLRNCRGYNLDFPFGPTHLNIKNLFAIVYGLHSEIGIDAACQQLGFQMEGTHHRGVDDAWNIANIFCHLIKRARTSRVS